MDQLAGRVAVITGAASGIGRGLARRCADADMRVVAADVEADPLTETVAMITEAGGTAIGVITDVSDGDQVDSLAERAYGEFDDVGLLFNNAGVFCGGVSWSRPLSDWEWSLGVNLYGLIHGMRAFVPRMIESGREGHIVNTASVTGIAASPFSGPYTTSKFAAVGLTESLQHDLAIAGVPIAASVLCPNAVDTGIADAARNRPAAFENPAGAGEDAEFVAASLAEITRVGLDPTEVADIVLAAVKAGDFYIATKASFDDMVRSRADDLLARRSPRMAVFD